MTILRFSNQCIRLSNNYRFGNFEKRSEEESKRAQADMFRHVAFFLFLAACIFWDSKDKGRERDIKGPPNRERPVSNQ
jgi:hypothetical protein